MPLCVCSRNLFSALSENAFKPKIDIMRGALYMT